MFVREYELANEAQFVALLHRIAAGLASEYWRASHAAKRTVHVEALDVSRHDQVGGEPDPAEVAAQADELQHMRGALGPRRAALLDALRDGLSITQASATRDRRAHGAALD